MVGTFYSRSLFLMLGVVILLSILGPGSRLSRAVFHAGQRVAVYRSRPLLRGEQHAHHLSVNDPPLNPPADPAVHYPDPFLRVPGGFAGRLGLGDPTCRPWGKLIDDSYNAGALSRMVLLGLELRSADDYRGWLFLPLDILLDRIFTHACEVNDPCPTKPFLKLTISFSTSAPPRGRRASMG